MRRASFAWSPDSDAKNSRVPDLAMVPMFATTSSNDMPMPLSRTVIVCASRVVGDRDAQVGLALVVIGMRERLEPELVDGVGGVADELAQEDLGMAVQRVDHELQQLLDFRLEAAGLRGCGGAGRRVGHANVRYAWFESGGMPAAIH